MGKTLLPPDYSIYDEKRFWKKMGGKAWRTAAIELSRGCPYACTFCCVPMQQHQHRVSRDLFAKYKGVDSKIAKQKDPYHREKPIPKFIEEVKKARDEYGINFVFITDESFLSMNKDRIQEFFEAYEKIKLPFFIETRVETVKPEYAKALERVGCAGVAMGVESGSITLRKSILGRMMPGMRELKPNIRATIIG